MPRTLEAEPRNATLPSCERGRAGHADARGGSTVGRLRRGARRSTTRCADALAEADAPVRLFPLEAANEMRACGSGCASTFLYEYGSDVLAKRRRVVEAGRELRGGSCAELAHERDLYDSDCGLGLGACEARCRRCPTGASRRAGMRLDVAAQRRGHARGGARGRAHERSRRSRRTRTRSPRRVARLRRAAAHAPRWSSCAARRTRRAVALAADPTASTRCAAATRLLRTTSRRRTPCSRYDTASRWWHGRA